MPLVTKPTSSHVHINFGSSFNIYITLFSKTIYDSTVVGGHAGGYFEKQGCNGVELSETLITADKTKHKRINTMSCV